MLILWSGGCDSTLALWQALEASKKPDAKKESIRAISIAHPQTTAREEQRDARIALKREFAKRGHSFEHHELRYDVNASYMPVHIGQGVAQPALWLAGAIPYLEEKEDLVAGWVAGDCIWHYRSYVFEAFSALTTMMGKDGKLKTPLEWTKKEEVIDRLEAEKLYEFVWWCEQPRQTTPCGTCTPCETHLGARTILGARRARAAAGSGDGTRVDPVRVDEPPTKVGEVAPNLQDQKAPKLGVGTVVDAHSVDLACG